MGRSDNPFLVNWDTHPFWVVKRPYARIYRGKTRVGHVWGFPELRGQLGGGLPKPQGCCAESPAGVGETAGAGETAGVGEN